MLTIINFLCLYWRPVVYLLGHTTWSITQKFKICFPCFLPFLCNKISYVLGNFILFWTCNTDVFDILYCTQTLFWANVVCKLRNLLLIIKRFTYNKNSIVGWGPKLLTFLIEHYLKFRYLFVLINENINQSIFLGRSPVINLCLKSRCAIRSQILFLNRWTRHPLL